MSDQTAGQISLNTNLLKTHERKLKSMESQISTLIHEVGHLQNAPSDPKLKAEFEKAMKEVGKQALGLRKRGKGLESNTNKAQKALPKQEQKKFQGQVGKSVARVSSAAKAVQKAVQKAAAKTAKAQAGKKADASTDKAAVAEAKSLSLRMAKLQVAMEKHQKAMAAMSNVSKASQEAAMKVIKNIK